jgi:hypothetical protein
MSDFLDGKVHEDQIRSLRGKAVLHGGDFMRLMVAFDELAAKAKEFKAVIDELGKMMLRRDPISGMILAEGWRRNSIIVIGLKQDSPALWRVLSIKAHQDALLAAAELETEYDLVRITPGEDIMGMNPERLWRIGLKGGPKIDTLTDEDIMGMAEERRKRAQSES